MAVDTDIERARTRAQTEQEAVEEMLDAYETFTRRVRKLQPDRTPSSVAGLTTAGGTTHLSADASSAEGCRPVRTAFDETIRPHSVASIDEPEPLLETIREEFTDAVAVALAPTTEAPFTPELEQMVLAEARSRLGERPRYRTHSNARKHTSTMRPKQSVTVSNGSSTRTRRR